MNTKMTFDRIAASPSNSTDTKSHSSRLASWLSNSWNSLIHHFTRGHELQVKQRRTVTGDVFYHAYDPYSGRSTYLTSDTDLRIWLEQLPYQE